MSSWRLWLLWLVLLLWDARPTVTKEYVFKGPKGGERSVRCPFSKNLNVTRSTFCKNDCEEGDILVQTSGSPQTNGRFSIEHEVKVSSPNDFIKVTISDLTPSDSGRYRCFWDRPVGSIYSEFQIEVTDDPDAASKSEVSLAAGEDFSFTYIFSNPGSKKTFCRNSCSEEDVLVATSGDEGQNGRYGIQYKKHTDGQSEVTVTIRNVSSADSGAYQVHLDQSSGQLWIKVSPAPPGGFPVTAFPPEAPPEQEPTGRPGGAPNTRTLILVLVPVCVVVLVTVITLTMGCMRRRRTDQGPGAGGTKDPQREYGNVYQNLCLEDMKAQPNASELHKI